MWGVLEAIQAKLLPVFGRLQRPAAWVLLVGAAATLVAVLFDLIALGNARLGTLLVAAGLVVDGFQAVQEAENEADEGGQAR